jgi:hypothetical protein
MGSSARPSDSCATHTPAARRGAEAADVLHQGLLLSPASRRRAAAVRACAGLRYPHSLTEEFGAHAWGRAIVWMFWSRCTRSGKLSATACRQEELWEAVGTDMILLGRRGFGGARARRAVSQQARLRLVRRAGHRPPPWRTRKPRRRRERSPEAAGAENAPPDSVKRPARRRGSGCRPEPPNPRRAAAAPVQPPRRPGGLEREAFGHALGRGRFRAAVQWREALRGPCDPSEQPVSNQQQPRPAAAGAPVSAASAARQRPVLVQAARGNGGAAIGD